jgi:hypothetical protein
MKFFKLKKKQLLKKFKREIKTFNELDRNITTEEIHTIAVLIENEQVFQRDIKGDLSRQFGIPKEGIDCLVYKSYQKNEEKNTEFISEIDFGWSGSLNLNSLSEFVKNDYDLLINYGFEENLYLKVITLRSQSKFKIGFATNDEGLYDLAISDDARNVETLNSETQKYLKILKKI